MEVLVLFVVVFLGGVIALARSRELFFVSVRKGRPLLVRGSISPTLWSELEAVVKASGGSGAVRVVWRRRKPALVVSGLDPSTAQRLRNAFEARGWKRQVQQPPGRRQRRNLGQVLGIAWLAWLLADRGAKGR